MKDCKTIKLTIGDFIAEEDNDVETVLRPLFLCLPKLIITLVKQF